MLRMKDLIAFFKRTQSTTLTGKFVAFGIFDLGVIEGIPEGSEYDLRMAPDEIATILIYHSGGRTSNHVIQSTSGTLKGPWKVGIEIGRNEG